LSKGVKISGNTVAFCGTGIIIHNSKDIEVSNNTVYRNTQSQLLLSQDRGLGIDSDDNIRNLNVQNNTFVGAGQGELSIHFKIHQNDISSFGIFNNNYVYNPYDPIVFRKDYKPGYPCDTKHTFDLFTLSEWQTETGMSLNSKSSSVFYGAEYIVNTIIEEKDISSPNFTSDISGWTGAGIIKPILSHEKNTTILGTPSLKIDFESNSGHTVVSHYSGSRFNKANDIIIIHDV